MDSTVLDDWTQASTVIGNISSDDLIQASMVTSDISSDNSMQTSMVTGDTSSMDSTVLDDWTQASTVIRNISSDNSMQASMVTGDIASDNSTQTSMVTGDISSVVVRYYASTTLVDAAAIDPSLGIPSAPIASNPYDPLFTVLTPASDLVFGGFSDYQVIFGRRGSDTLYGFDHSLSSTQTPIDIDVFYGKTDPVGINVAVSFLGTLGGNPPSGGNDRFVLGDWNRSYYDKAGYNDFAAILDFNRQSDTIQLHGTADDYQLVSIPIVGTAIFQKTQASQNPLDGDLVGIVFATNNLDLNSANFQYAGYTPPPGPVEPLIKQIGTDGLDLATSIATDSLGDVYVAGFTNGALQGTNAGSYDNWVAKYDSNGKQQWIKQFGSSKGDQIQNIVADSSGNFYIAGATQGNLAGPLQSTAEDAVVAKYDSDGNQVWIKQFGESSLNAATNITLDESGNLYVSGLTLTGDKRPVAVIDAQDDFWVTKFDNNGNQDWFTKVATPLTYPAIWDEAYGIAYSKDGSGSIYSTGWTYGGLAQPNANLGTYDTWITKFQNNGEVAWIKQFGSTSFDFGWSVDTDTKGNVYSYGWTQGDLGGQLQGFSDLFLSKYDSDGNQIFLKQFGTSGDDAAFIGGMKIDSNNNIFITGYTNGDFGGPNAGSYDAFVARYDTDGNQVWAKQFGTSALDYATNLSVDNAGNVYVTGFTEGSLGGLNAGSVDSWVAKVDANSGNLENFNQSVCSSQTPHKNFAEMKAAALSNSAMRSHNPLNNELSQGSTQSGNNSLLASSISHLSGLGAKSLLPA